MIRWTRTAQVARGKHQEAIQWAKDTREYTRTKFEGGADVKIFLETLGDFGVICWMVDFENLAMLELAGNVLDEDGNCYTCGRYMSCVEKTNENTNPIAIE